MTELVITFPRMGNYHIVLEKSIGILFPHAKVLAPPPITAKTLELGTRHSPENVCAPFKYNIGNFIEALDAGANTLLQTGTGCIFGYYGQVQEKILRDMGYSFNFLCFGRGSGRSAYENYRKIGGRLSLAKVTKAIFLAYTAMHAIDSFEYAMRENMAFEKIPGSHDALHARFLLELAHAPLTTMPFLWPKYKQLLKAIPLQRPATPLRVGLVGELYTLMEPTASFDLERELSQAGCSVSRRMCASFLARPHTKKAMTAAGGYLTHAPGANGADSVAQSLQYANAGYDGVIHLKSFGCTPEINVTPALDRLSRDTGMPILHLSFDTHTAQAGLQTRVEAFVDMLVAKQQA